MMGSKNLNDNQITTRDSCNGFKNPSDGFMMIEICRKWLVLKSKGGYKRQLWTHNSYPNSNVGKYIHLFQNCSSICLFMIVNI